jgi:hypothetical protein
MTSTTIADAAHQAADILRPFGDADPAVPRIVRALESLGSGGRTTDVFAEAQRKAEEIRKADPKLSPEQALERAMEGDPDLQQRYLAEQRGAA